MESRYLYRGTTEGWSGNQVLQDQKITCTTTDPLVATLFGIECRNHGHAVILAAPENLFVGLTGPLNHFAAFESAVNLLMPPQDFARRVQLVLDLDEAMRILGEMGFDQIPVRIGDKWSLRQALIGSYEAGQRLSEAQLQYFTTRILGARQ